MKAAIPWLGVVLCAGAAATPTPAQYPVPYVTPVAHVPLAPAPDCCGPGYYVTSPAGVTYGPNYYVLPPFAPYSGVAPPPFRPGCPQGPMATSNGPLPPDATGFPSHPYTRGPRDFFMFTEVQRERVTREQRPPLVP
jgi:hypothetical protein